MFKRGCFRFSRKWQIPISQPYCRHRGIVRATYSLAVDGINRRLARHARRRLRHLFRLAMTGIQRSKN